MENHKLLLRSLRLLNIFLYFLLGIAALIALGMLSGGGHSNVPLRTIYPIIGLILVIIVILITLSAYLRKLQ
jgi:hypothetical protein